MASAGKHSKSGVKSSKSSNLTAGPSNAAAAAGKKRSRDQIGASAVVPVAKPVVGSKRKAAEQEAVVKVKKLSKHTSTSAAGVATNTVRIEQKTVTVSEQASATAGTKKKKLKNKQQPAASDAKQPKAAAAAANSTTKGADAAVTNGSLYKSKHLSALSNKVKTVIKTKALVVKQAVATSTSSSVETVTKWKDCKPYKTAAVSKHIMQRKHARGTMRCCSIRVVYTQLFGTSSGLPLSAVTASASVQNKAKSKPNELNEAVALAKGQHLQQETDAKEQKRAGHNHSSCGLVHGVAIYHSNQCHSTLVASQRKLKQSGQEPTPEECAQYVGLDCEMVGVGFGGKTSVLAQCCVTDWWGNTLYNAYVKPVERVTDFRTFVSGVRAKHLKSGDAVTLRQCQAAVVPLLKDRILVGHALQNDLKALMLSHPHNMIRDTATYRPFKAANRTGKLQPRPQLTNTQQYSVVYAQRFMLYRNPLAFALNTDCYCARWRWSLKKLALQYLDRTIQTGEHDPAVDATAAMDLYKLKRAEWENSLKEVRGGGSSSGRNTVYKSKKSRNTAF
eukprot:19460-Heterococcus_DN1.PRE.4